MRLTKKKIKQKLIKKEEKKGRRYVGDLKNIPIFIDNTLTDLSGWKL